MGGRGAGGMNRVLGLIKYKNLRMDSNGNSRTVLFYFKIKTSGQVSCLESKGERVKPSHSSCH